MWEAIGKTSGRADVSAHAKELLDVSPKILADLHASLNKTIYATGNPRAPRCVPSGADPSTGLPQGCLGDFRGYNELVRKRPCNTWFFLYGGCLTSYGQNESCGAERILYLKKFERFTEDTKFLCA